MKFSNLFIVFGLVIILSNCNKKLFDKRTKYIGDYDFQIQITCTPSLGNCDTNYQYSGFIDYSDDKEKVIIQFENNFIIEPLIDNNGNLIQHIDHYQSDSLGRFINENEVEFVIRTGGLGGGYFRNVYGKKR